MEQKKNTNMNAFKMRTNSDKIHAEWQNESDENRTKLNLLSVKSYDKCERMLVVFLMWLFAHNVVAFFSLSDIIPAQMLNRSAKHMHLF